ncbi:golgin subfamily A member 5-like [Uloborus diversus]|uniref:golgin subfamily A member 5-like n=1 Tax=Uloborus diversus TaxID=327109 RepID=UPI00240A154B|nr:golgin subfamily A member 5-like [Uloborus diversus]
MSWFTEIAGKAEDLLNKVDQTAATALQNKTKTHSYSQNNLYYPSAGDREPGHSSALSYSPSRRIPTSPPRPLGATKTYVSASTTPGKKPESDDEKLLRYLNCAEALPPPESKPRMKESVNKVADDVPVSFVEEMVSIDTEAIEQKPHQIPKKEDKTSDIVTQQVADDGLQKPLVDTLDHAPSQDILPESNVPVSADDQDLQLAQKRAHHAEAEMKRMVKKLDHWNSQISGNDKVVRELREREKDMAAAMDAKDSQLAILKVRLQEADQELYLKRSVIEELKAENERLIREHAESATLQNGTLGALQDQLQQVEAELNKAKDALQQSQNEHMQQRSKMEEEHRHLVDSYSSLQKKWNDMNERNKELVSQLKSANGNFDTLQQEYNDYKQKAQRILQSKEKLISSLKDGNYDLESAESSSAVSNAEVEVVKQERDLLREELRRANELTDTYRSEIQELEKISQNELASAEQRCRLLKEQLEMEKVLKEELQGVNNQFKEEVQLLKEDLTRTKTTFQSRLQDREIEIEKLRRQLTAKSLSTVSQDELESRLHALTENLIQKQTVVEALSTEKNSLVLQLERMEQQLREAQNYGFHQHTYVGMNNNESDRKAKAVFLENPFDSALTRRVKRVYGSIDSLSIRLGVFFRRYPISRVFVFVYMLLLHFWVMVVLLTYEPEIHHSSPGNVNRR